MSRTKEDGRDGTKGGWQAGEKRGIRQERDYVVKTDVRGVDLAVVPIGRWQRNEILICADVFNRERRSER